MVRGQLCNIYRVIVWNSNSANKRWIEKSPRCPYQEVSLLSPSPSKVTCTARSNKLPCLVKKRTPRLVAILKASASPRQAFVNQSIVTNSITCYVLARTVVTCWTDRCVSLSCLCRPSTSCTAVRARSNNIPDSCIQRTPRLITILITAAIWSHTLIDLAIVGNSVTGNIETDFFIVRFRTWRWCRSAAVTRTWKLIPCHFGVVRIVVGPWFKFRPTASWKWTVELDHISKNETLKCTKSYLQYK